MTQSQVAECVDRIKDIEAFLVSKPEKGWLSKSAERMRAIMLDLMEEQFDKEGITALTNSEKIKLLNLFFGCQKDGGIFITQQDRGNYEFCYKGFLFGDSNTNVYSVQ